MEMNNMQLVKYDAALNALAECKSVDEVKDWADKAAALQAYGLMAQDKTLEVDAAEIRIRAERRLGEMLAEQKASGGMNTGAAGTGINQYSPKEVRSSVTTAPTLADVGISKDLSARAQKLAAVPEAQFEAEVGEWRERAEAEGARVSARLEAAGDAALNKTPPAPPAKTPEQERIEELEAQVDELAANLKGALDDLESMSRVLDAGDKLEAALAEAKRYRELSRVLQSRINGLLNEKNSAMAAAKKWMNKWKRLERASGVRTTDEF